LRESQRNDDLPSFEAFVESLFRGVAIPDDQVADVAHADDAVGRRLDGAWGIDRALARTIDAGILGGLPADQSTYVFGPEPPPGGAIHDPW
jgi:hypothetical protein